MASGDFCLAVDRFCEEPGHFQGDTDDLISFASVRED